MEIVFYTLEIRIYKRQEKHIVYQIEAIMGTNCICHDIILPFHIIFYACIRLLRYTYTFNKTVLFCLVVVVVVIVMKWNVLLFKLFLYSTLIITSFKWLSLYFCVVFSVMYSAFFTLLFFFSPFDLASAVYVDSEDSDGWAFVPLISVIALKQRSNSKIKEIFSYVCIK